MSYKLLYRLRSVGGIPGPEKSVLRFLAELSENHETAWHPVEQLAFQTGFSVRTVQRALRSLECRGILILIGGKKGRGSTPIYRIDLDAAAPVAQPPVESVPVVTEPLPPTNGAKPTLTDEQRAERDAEQLARHHAKYEAMKAAIAAKKREERRERPGRSARHQAGPV